MNLFRDGWLKKSPGAQASSSSPCAILLGLLLAACAETENPSTATGIDASEGPADSGADGEGPAERLTFRELTDRCGAQRANAGARVIETSEDLMNAFEQAFPDEEDRPPLPEVDFERSVVVEARWGEGHVDDQYRVAEVREFATTVEVMLEFRTRCSDGDDEWYVCSLTEVPRRDKPYEFQERHATVRSDAGGFCAPGHVVDRSALGE